MYLHQLSAWLATTALNRAMQTTSWAIPGIQTVHIIALSLVFTAALLLWLRFTGFGFSMTPLAEFTTRCTRLIWPPLAVLLVSGTLLIIAEPDRTITNRVFYVKMLLLAFAVATTLWLSGASRRRPERPAAQHAFIATFGMFLWTGIIFAGRFIAYVED